MNEQSMWKRWGLVLVIAVLALGNLYFLVKESREEETDPQGALSAEAHLANTKVVNFMKLFVGKVLAASGEIDFESRLQLENAVRDINDPELLAQWQKFVASTSETQAQQEVNRLLLLLINKIQ